MMGAREEFRTEIRDFRGKTPLSAGRREALKGQARNQGARDSQARNQKGSSGSTAIASDSTERYVMEPWKTRIGFPSSPRIALP